ncbi:Response regulatory domain-containing protein [Sulfidibacter corallicola]
MAERHCVLISRSQIQTRVITAKMRDMGFHVDAIVDDPSKWQDALGQQDAKRVDFLVIDFDSDPLIALSLLDHLHALPEWFDKPVFFVSRSLSEREIQRFLTQMRVCFIQIPAPKEEMEAIIRRYLDEQPVETTNALLENPLPKKVQAFHLITGKPHFLPADTSLVAVAHYLAQQDATYVLAETEAGLGIHTQRRHLRAIRDGVDPESTPLAAYLNMHLLQLPHDVDWTIAFTTFAGGGTRHLVLRNETDQVVGVLEPECFHRVVLRRIFVSEYG